MSKRDKTINYILLAVVLFLCTFSESIVNAILG